MARDTEESHIDYDTYEHRIDAMTTDARSGSVTNESYRKRGRACKVKSDIEMKSIRLGRAQQGNLKDSIVSMVGSRVNDRWVIAQNDGNIVVRNGDDRIIRTIRSGIGSLAKARISKNRLVVLNLKTDGHDFIEEGSVSVYNIYTGVKVAGITKSILGGDIVMTEDGGEVVLLNTDANKLEVYGISKLNLLKTCAAPNATSIMLGAKNDEVLLYSTFRKTPITRINIETCHSSVALKDRIRAYAVIRDQSRSDAYYVANGKMEIKRYDALHEGRLKEIVKTKMTSHVTSMVWAKGCVVAALTNNEVVVLDPVKLKIKGKKRVGGGRIWEMLFMKTSRHRLLVGTVNGFIWELDIWRGCGSGGGPHRG